MERGEVWWANLSNPVGSGPGYRRPVLVIQSDALNQSKIQTVVVVAITSNLELSGAPGNVTVTPRSTGLPKDSVINVSQVLTIDRALLGEYAGTIPVRKMNQVDHGLRLALSL